MSVRAIRVFRYDPSLGGEGGFEGYSLEIADESNTTILDVLLRLQREQDATLAFRYACRVNMCGSCAMVINGKEGLACKTNVSDFPAGKEITLRPLNHFPIIKDLVVDMEPFFTKYEASLPFFEPKGEYEEPLKIRPDAPERLDIGLATECIACGCCVSSCTMFHYHDEYAGPAALNRAFTLLADSRDALFDQRMTKVLDSCYHCRTEFNCTEVCPKSISGTRAIKYIQRLALKHRNDKDPVAVPAAAPQPEPPVMVDRRSFLRKVGVGVMGLGSALALGGVLATTTVGPTLAVTPKQWIPVGELKDFPDGDITTLPLKYEIKSGIYTQPVTMPVLVSRQGDEIICFKASCTHLGCIVHWDALSGRFRCACHGGAFDRKGNVIAGPPPRPLERYSFRVDAGMLYVEVC
jgi:succinate dehydrogenase / fumarate reductase, iron-sulfur subunit